MKVGIVGLGLIGGSMAKAYKEAGHTVLGYDNSPVPQGYAEMNRIIEGRLTMENIGSCGSSFRRYQPKCPAPFIQQVASGLYFPISKLVETIPNAPARASGK